MSHGFAERLHHDEQRIKVVLESAMLQYGVLFGMLLLLIVIGIALAYLQP